MDMAEIRAQFRQVLLNIYTSPIPPEQRLNGESVPQIMEPRSIAVAWASQAYPPRQSHKGSLDDAYVQSAAALVHKEAFHPWKKPIPEFDIVLECFQGGGMEGEHP